MKRLLKLSILSMLCLVLLLGSTAMAAGPVDTAAKGTITLTFAPDGNAAEGAYFQFYKIAEVNSAGQFTPVSEIKSVSHLAEEGSLADADLLAAELTEQEPDYGTMATDLLYWTGALPAAAAGSTDADGKLTAELGVGLYLVTGNAFVTEDKNYIPVPFMLAVPTIPAREEGAETGEEAADDWLYSPDVTVKSYESYTRFTVEKIWSDSATNDHSKDEVVVELHADGDFAATTFLSKENDWEGVLFDLSDENWSSIQHDWLKNVQSWTVEEVDVPEGYTVSYEQVGNHFIITNTKDPEIPEGPLPQTGLLWWPVPILAVAGIALLLIALAAKNKGKDNG